MIQKTFYLDEGIVSAFKKQAVRSGCTEVSLLRRIIWKYLSENNCMIEVVKKEVNPEEKIECPFLVLGVNGRDYFFERRDGVNDGQIVQLRLDVVGWNTMMMKLFHLAPLEYWSQCYPGKTLGFNRRAAIADLRDRCRQKGLYTRRPI